MKVLFDTNVVLDVLLDRRPFAETAVRLFADVELGVCRGYLCGTTVTTVYYLAHKMIGASRAKAEIRKLLQLFEVAAVDKAVLEGAAASPFSDF